MAFLAGAAITGITSLIGGLLGSKGKKKAALEKRRLHQQAVGIYEGFMKDPKYDPLRGEGMYKDAIGSVQQGFQGAKRNLSLAGTTARQSVVTGGQQAAANMQQSMMSRGLFGTTAFDNAQRGISSDVSRNLASVNENVGRMMSALSAQRGMAVAGAQQNLGQFYGQATALKQNQIENFINLLRDKPSKFSNTAAFGNALGQAAGAFGSIYAMGKMMGPGVNPLSSSANPYATGYLAPGQFGPQYVPY